MVNLVNPKTRAASLAKLGATLLAVWLLPGIWLSAQSAASAANQRAAAYAPDAVAAPLWFRTTPE